MMLHRHLMDLKDLDKARAVEGTPQIHSEDLQPRIPKVKEQSKPMS